MTMTGTHNSLTGERALHWWMRPFRFVWRCQSKTLREQIDAGVKVFDIRCRMVNGMWMGAHGACVMNYRADLAIQLIANAEMLNKVDSPIVRLILEKGDAQTRKDFATFCHYVETHFPNIRFIGGRYKPTWARLYQFCNDEDNITQICGSMDERGGWRRLIGKIWPWGWHRWLKPDSEGRGQGDDGIVIEDFL